MRRLLAARAAPDALEAKAESHLIMALGPILDGFVAELFGIGDALDALVARNRHLDPVHACKRLFVQRQAVKKYADPSGFDGAALRAELEADDGRDADRGRPSPPMSRPGSATTARSCSTRRCATPPGRR